VSMGGRANNPFFDSEPGGREAAPGPLALVQAFVNTREAERGWETLTDPEALSRWLRERRLLSRGSRVEDEDVERARELREALRALLAANNGGEVEEGVVAALNGASARARLGVRFGRNGRTILAPAARGVDGALGRVVAAVHAGMEDGTWARLKACRNPVCSWAFYDRSKNRSGRWCSMGICGNRTKTRSYRRRKQLAGD
jgi:predicted RNA-binding Zn ribbon-like protein